jgi:hypothetical protein
VDIPAGIFYGDRIVQTGHALSVPGLNNLISVH